MVINQGVWEAHSRRAAPWGACTAPGDSSSAVMKTRNVDMGANSSPAGNEVSIAPGTKNCQ
jgi:hypothetical protein